MEQENNKLEIKVKKTLQYAAIFVAIFTPYTYLLGLTYYQGYMNAFGVEAESFPLATADIYVNAYIAIGFMILDIVEVAITLFQAPLFYGVLLALVLVTYFIVKTGRYLKSFNLRKNHKLISVKIINFLHYKNNDLTKALAYVFIFTYAVMILVYVLSLISIFWWGLPVWASHKGDSEAKNKIEKYLKNGCFVDSKTNWNSCALILNTEGVILHEGLLIAKSDRESAIFKKDGSYLIKLNDDFIMRKKRN
jgi:hypothetical protein